MRGKVLVLTALLGISLISCIGSALAVSYDYNPTDTAYYDPSVGGTSLTNDTYYYGDATTGEVFTNTGTDTGWNDFTQSGNTYLYDPSATANVTPTPVDEEALLSLSLVDPKLAKSDMNGNLYDGLGNPVGYNEKTGATYDPTKCPDCNLNPTAPKTSLLPAGAGSSLVDYACKQALGTKNCDKVKNFVSGAKATVAKKTTAPAAGGGTGAGGGTTPLPAGNGNGGTLNSTTKIPTIEDIKNALPGANVSTNTSDILTVILNYFFEIIGVAAFASVLYSGFMYVTSAGDEQKTTTARRNLVWALTGIILAIVALTILNFIAGKL